MKKLPSKLTSAKDHPRRRRGRPTRYTEDLADAIWDAVRAFGDSDTAAAAQHGVTASTISRWKRENEDFAADLEAARAEFRHEIIAKIRGATKRDGTIDWRALAWILERVFPDEFGRRARSAKSSQPAPTPEPEPPVTPEQLSAETGAKPGTGRVLTPEDLEIVQQRREVVLRAMAEKRQEKIEARAREMYAEWQRSQNSQIPSGTAPENPENIAEIHADAAPSPTHPAAAPRKIPAMHNWLSHGC